MDDFDSKAYTLRTLLKNEIEGPDRTKNYYIPRYQRPYAWGKYQAQALVESILNQRQEDPKSSYLIGGIVLSRESIEENRTDISLEVIDGQQRLTTILIICAVIVQLLKFRHYDKDLDELKEHLIEDLSTTIKRKVYDEESGRMKTQHTLERSDRLNKDFLKTLDVLVDEEVYKRNDLKKELSDVAEVKDLLTVTIAILHDLEILSFHELTGFARFLLNNTWVVVTKTSSVDAGITIFESLNDGGMRLEPQDLLKNYLFNNIEQGNHENLTEQWQTLMDIIKEINPGTGRMKPKDFLEHYLNIVGFSRAVDKKKESLFKRYKEHASSEQYKTTMELISNMITIAKEYQKIKNMEMTKAYLGDLSFNLGYQILLAFYNKYGNDYVEVLPQILLCTTRLGGVYIPIRKSKELSVEVPRICNKISNSKDITHGLNILQNEINKSLQNQKAEYEVLLKVNNVYRSQLWMIILLNMIEFSLTGTRIKNINNCAIGLLLPRKVNQDCTYEGVSETTNMDLYPEQIGNFIIKDNETDESDSMCFLDRYASMTGDNSLTINNLQKLPQVSNKEIILIDSKFPQDTWGIEYIIMRSQAFTEVAIEIMFEGNIKDSFFHSYEVTENS